MAGTTINTASDSKLEQLRAILYLLQTHLEDFKGEVDRSYDLLSVGEKTELSKQIENTISNPMAGVFKISSNIDAQVKDIIDKFVRAFLQSKKSIIKEAFKSKTSLNDLHYSIVLTDDNIHNRMTIFHFFEKFDLFDIASKYPVYIQFVPEELVSKIKQAEKLEFE